MTDQLKQEVYPILEDIQKSFDIKLESGSGS
jgi:hypothetical protein